MSLWNVYPDDSISNKRFEKWKRWYSFGMIQVADFNGDGLVNNSDQLDLYEAMNNWSPGEVTVFGSGDVNQDGTITYADFQEWLAAYDAYIAWMNAGSNPNTKPARVDYGGMDDL